MGDVVSTSINREPASWESAAPHTSLVIACFGVAEYLPAFFASLEAQTADHAGYELVFVIDGSPDDSEQRVREWMATTDYAVRLVTQPNGGVASARNTGLAWARGDWVSHPDPDDRLDAGYLSALEAARAAFPGETMFAARAVLTSPAGEELGHTLDARYAGASDSLIDLAAEPRKIHTLGGVAVFRRSVIDAHGLRFDERILQSSDTDFIGHFLLCNGARYVLVPGARYQYLRRADGSSIVSAHSGNMSRYASLFGVSHRGLLDRAGEECPQWLANLLLYFVFMLFRRNRRADTPVDLASEAELARIRAELTQNLARIGVRGIRRFDLFAVPLEFRAAWLAAVEELRSSPVEHLLWAPAAGTRRIAIYSSRPVPPAGLRADGGIAAIVSEKRRPVEFLGDTWAYQHVLVVRPSRGAPQRLRCDAGFALEFGGEVLGAAELRARAGLAEPIAVQPRASSPGRAVPDAAGRGGRFAAFPALALHRLAGRRAWVFAVDERSNSAGCEALCAYVARQVPGVGTWAVLAERSRHAGRLRAAGARVVVAGSPAHLAVMRRADVVCTPRIDRSSTDPFPGSGLRRTWRIVLLPSAELDRLSHRDASTARADLVPVSSAVELERVAGRFGPSLVMPGSARLTGLPHHDLLEAARREPEALVLAPSWPRFLPHPAALTPTDLAAVRETRFVAEWDALLRMPELRGVARRTVLLPPDGAPAGLFEPSGAEVATTPSERIAALGGAAAVLTDYSTETALDAAYLGRPTVFLHSEPSARLGAPDSPRSRASAFREEGFGPVVPDAARAVEELVRLAAGVPDRYLRRIERAFSARDGRARARLVEELTG